MDIFRIQLYIFIYYIYLYIFLYKKFFTENLKGVFLEIMFLKFPLYKTLIIRLT